MERGPTRRDIAAYRVVGQYLCRKSIRQAFKLSSPPNRYALYKLRVRNSDNRKGKSGGYRLIYYLRTTERLILVTIYSKSDQGDISKKRLASILNEFTQSQTIE
ncbi:MAG: hypothetical protein DCC52_09840 [Chloroflexi bacterium]|nr:MAG: hypothetical protein DCC52_09840 [Chloroflexota bacterium]